MKISEFKKLEKKINNYNFNQGYRNINILMFILSILGHFTAIFLASFALTKLLGGVIENSPASVLIISLVLLSGLELLKRDIFDKFSIQYLKIKSINKDVLPLMLLSLLLVSISFYASIHGAKEFSSKEKIIEQNKKEIVNQFSDSLTTIYNVKFTEIDNEIKIVKNKIDEKDKEQTELEAVQPPTRSARQRIKDLKDEKVILRTDISKLESDKNNLKIQLTDEIKNHETEVSLETEDKKKSNNNNSIAFIILSTFIEFIILVGVYFNEYYKFRSYSEYRSKIEKDPNFQKWFLYEQMLNTIYREDYKVNQKLPTIKIMSESLKSNDIIVMPRDITNFLNLMSSLGIIKTTGSIKYINKQREMAFESLKAHFNIS